MLRLSSPTGRWSRLSATNSVNTINENNRIYTRQKDPNRPTGSYPHLMIKHTHLVPTNVTRSYLTFDLSKATKESVAEAELILQVHSSGLGFYALAPDSRFTIYGIDYDDWKESEPLWDNDPDLELDETKKLATFEVPKGATMSQVKASSEELAALIRSTNDGLATFIIVCETGDLENQGLVHAFATNEPPTLQIKNKEHAL